MEEEMTRDEAEEILMAHMVGSNYPPHLLAQATLMLSCEEGEESNE